MIDDTTSEVTDKLLDEKGSRFGQQSTIEGIPKFNVHETPLIFKSLFERAMTRARHIPSFFFDGEFEVSQSSSHPVSVGLFSRSVEMVSAP